MRGWNFNPRRSKAGAVAQVAMALTSILLATPAPAQGHLALSSCQEMNRDIAGVEDRSGEVSAAISSGNWVQVRRYFAAGYPLPPGLADATRARAMREYRSAELLYAAARGQLGRINKLLSQGADPNFEAPLDSFATPLAWAARCNRTVAAERLIRAGARVNYRFTYADATFVHHGGTALIWASDAGSVAMVQLLLRRGARVDIRETSFWPNRGTTAPGVTALDVAANGTITRLLRSRLQAESDGARRRA